MFLFLSCVYFLLSPKHAATSLLPSGHVHSSQVPFFRLMVIVFHALTFSILHFRIGVLKSQLRNYKKIISKRVGINTPVITYQDNMQMFRTSLRHLRLSKLQEDKLKQGKMWDFTVRGWMEADISGIEANFEKDDLALKPQQEVKSLKYEDTKIG